MKDKFKQIQNLNSEKKQQNEQKDKVQQRESETQIQNLNSEQKQINEKQDEIQLSECETYIWNYNSEQKQINEQQEEIQLSKCETQRWSYNSKLKQINEQQDEIQLSECETYIWNYNSEQKQINEQQEEIQLSGSETQIQNLNSEKKQQNEQQEKVQFSQSEEQILKNFKTQIDNFKKEHQQQITYEKQTKLASGYFRIDDRFKILFNSFCNLTYLKAKQKLKQPKITEIEKDTTYMKFKIAENCSFQNSSFIYKCKDQSELAELINVMKTVDKYVENRYLNQVQEKDHPNLTSLAQAEIIETQIQYSIDLHPLAIESELELDFIKSVEKELRKKLEELFKVNNKMSNDQQFYLKEQIEKRVQVLYQSQNNYRIRAFYRSVHLLKGYFKQ